MRQALIVFAKVPEPGKVKTRLSPPLTPDEAASLYESFLLDAIKVYNQLEVDIFIYVGSETPARRKYPALADARIQKGAGLGQRMLNAFRDIFREGYDRVGIIGTDHPTLPLDFVTDAFHELGSNDVVIGPSKDGGYYLLASDKPQPALFQDMTYSHEQVFAETMDRALKAKLGLHVLPEWYDVDDADALSRLALDLKTTGEDLRRTRQSMTALVAKYPDVFDL